MPNSNLPQDDYLGNPNRTTSEFQDAINDLLNWVNTLQAELDALSGTTVREGAVRDVGSGGSELVENDAIDTAARQKADQDLRTTDSVQFGRVTDAATPGEGDFDSDKLGYWEATVELGGEFDAGESVKCIRIGSVVTITGANGRMSHVSTSTPESASGAIPSAFRPSERAVNVFQISDVAVEYIQVQPDGRLYFLYKDWDGNDVSGTATGEAPTISYNV